MCFKPFYFSLYFPPLLSLLQAYVTWAHLRTPASYICRKQHIFVFATLPRFHLTRQIMVSLQSFCQLNDLVSSCPLFPFSLRGTGASNTLNDFSFFTKVSQIVWFCFWFCYFPLNTGSIKHLKRSDYYFRWGRLISGYAEGNMQIITVSISKRFVLVRGMVRDDKGR